VASDAPEVERLNLACLHIAHVGDDDLLRAI
jgi:hypothetical protein